MEEHVDQGPYADLDGVKGQSSGNPMEEFLSQDSTAYRPPQRGDILDGTIVSASSSEILVDVGYKTEGVVSSRDMARMDAQALEDLHEGDSVLAYVVKPGDQDGNLILSLRRAELEKDWRAAEEVFKAGKPFGATISGFNKGGLIVHMGKVRGFVPASQLAHPPRRTVDAAASDEQSPFASLVGHESRFRIIELDRKRNRLILSERAAMRQGRQRRKDELLAELKEGEVRRGVVSSLCAFGAFIDLGGGDGLAHLSELSWGRVSHPSEVLSVGDEIDVQILAIDRERKRIALSIKRLQPEPWSTVEDDYHVDDRIDGTITKLTDFGAFARLGTGIEGLIHISELSDERVGHPGEVVTEGETYALRVIRVDGARRRIGLSLRRAVDEVDFAEMANTEDWQEVSGEPADDAPASPEPTESLPSSEDSAAE
jgi:small subunit ribosomal protein S1